MDKNERNSEIKEIANRLYDDMLDIVHYRFDLEELNCKREAALLDTIVGKLETVTAKLHNKTTKGR